MGILNITPDSFFAGSRVQTEVDYLKKAESMIKDGVWMIDVGGYSSRPGATDISIEEESNRVLPVIKSLAKHFPEVFISVDTFRSELARQAVEAGADVVNDISGGLLDSNMLNVVKRCKVPYIAMHMRGNPQNMVTHSKYNHVTHEVVHELAKQVNEIVSAGIADFAIDPGFGFAKTREQNFELLKALEYFQIFNQPIVAGVSRKSMIWKTLQLSAAEALPGTIALNTIALLKKASILRVHDVAEAVQAVTLWQETEL
ncbi:MAG: dihydropteroate synthase [Chryseotalea sp.]